MLTQVVLAPHPHEAKDATELPLLYQIIRDFLSGLPLGHCFFNKCWLPTDPEVHMRNR